MTITWLLVFLCAIIVFYKKRRTKPIENLEYLGIESVPLGTPYFPFKLIGNLPILFPLSSVLHYSSQITNYNMGNKDILKFVGGGFEIVLLNSPQLVQTLLKSNNPGHLLKSKLVYGSMKPFITNGVLVSKREMWQRERRILIRSQRFQALTGYMELLNKHSMSFVAQVENLFEDGEAHEMFKEINVLFLKIISEMITGKDLDAVEIEKYHQSFEIWKTYLAYRILLNPWCSWLLDKIPFAINRKWNVAVREMNEFAKRRIRDHREKRSSSHHKDLRTRQFRSVLDELMDAGVDDEVQIIDEINTMIFGGHETGAGLIHSFFFAMACNPSIQALCHNEIDTLFSDPNSFTSTPNLTYEAVQSLKYLERCIQETLRLYPSVFIFFRQLESPLRLHCQDTKIELPVGTIVSVFPFGMHRKPEYFPDPGSFNPDRFIPEETFKRHPYAYIPFSSGPRSCLGIKFAMLEMKTIAAHVLRNFTITTIDSPENEVLLPFVTVTPAKNYRFKLTKRNVAK